MTGILDRNPVSGPEPRRFHHDAEHQDGAGRHQDRIDPAAQPQQTVVQQNRPILRARDHGQGIPQHRRAAARRTRNKI